MGYNKDAPNNWISLKKFENRRDIAHGKIVLSQNGNVPKAWINIKTKRALYIPTPLSSKLSLGELKNRTIYNLDSVDVTDNNGFVDNEKKMNKAFDYMRNDNGMTPISDYMEI